MSRWVGEEKKHVTSKLLEIYELYGKIQGVINQIQDLDYKYLSSSVIQGILNIEQNINKSFARHKSEIYNELLDNKLPKISQFELYSQYELINEEIRALQSNIVLDHFHYSEYLISKLNKRIINNLLIILLLLCLLIIYMWVVDKYLLSPLQYIRLVSYKLACGEKISKFIQKKAYTDIERVINNLIQVNERQNEPLNLIDLNKKTNDIDIHIANCENFIANKELMVKLKAINAFSDVILTSNKEISSKLEQVSGVGKEISDEVVSISNQISSINDCNERSKKIIYLVEELLENAHFLSLNLSISSSKVGDNRKDFILLADEIRDLSDNVSNYLKELKIVAGGIQHESSLISNSMINIRNAIDGMTDIANIIAEQLDNQMMTTSNIIANTKAH
jgi:methyl-accepting chemotaxis protein